MQSYAALQDGDQEESGVMVHVVDNESRTRWNHIDDLDSFFTRMYRYHQQHGFYCMMLQEFLELCQFVFVVFFTTFLLHCVDYPVMFKEVPINTTKITLADVIYSPQECKSHFSPFTWIALCSAAIIWSLKLIRSVINTFHNWEIKQFFNGALDVSDSELDNLTWHEIQTRARNVQLREQMCIHKRELTELDIYHRILRQQNYMIAMANKRLIPPRLRLPFIGEIVYWTRSLRYNIQFLLFWGPWAPFENPWHLRENYRKPNMRHELSRQLGRHVLWLVFANLMLSPLIFIWQILHAFFSYAETIKREPGSLGVRNWSLYGRLYLRHFNELEHELNARLNRAHRPAAKYLSAFSSPIATVLARSFGFMCGAILAVLLLLTVYDEDVIQVEHVLTMITLFGASLAIFRAVIPDETMAWCPETLLANVLAHTHYLPRGWKNHAHTARIRAEFQQLFQIRIVGVLEELLSPLVTPYLLWKHIYPRTLDFVDFYRNFSVSVVGVGDVCSFAQMDVRKHGNPDWQGGCAVASAAPDQYTQAEDGKTELSLMHFKMTNPSWNPPPESLRFVEAVERESSLIMPHSDGELFLNTDLTDSSIRGDAYRLEGPLNSNIENMSLSTLYLHDRHYRQVGSRYRRPAEETTPLLQSN